MKNVQVSALRNSDYFYFMLQAVERAESRIWAAVFSMNLNFLDDRNLHVRDFAKALIHAHERGVDVRILLSGERTEYNAFRVANETAYDYLASKSIDIRRYASSDKKQSHAKYVIVDDDWAILGSHNWSPRSFAAGRDDSVALRSSELNERLRRTFENDWQLGEAARVS